MAYLYNSISMKLKEAYSEQLTSSSRAGATSIACVEILPGPVNKLKFQRRGWSGIAWGVSTGWGVKCRKLSKSCQRRPGGDGLVIGAKRRGVRFVVSSSQKLFPCINVRLARSQEIQHSTHISCHSPAIGLLSRSGGDIEDLPNM
jgi:hypothetical protein